MRILHTEASGGWGGQELRVLQEAKGMRSRGHQIILAVQKGGGLVEAARVAGFLVFEIEFKKRRAPLLLWQLFTLLHRHKIDIINTHSSLDAWIGGMAGKIKGCRVIRTRHLSTPIRKGFNSLLLYNWLTDQVVTTCASAAQTIRVQASLPPHRCLSIPTGVDTEVIGYDPKEVQKFRAQLGIEPSDCLVGTVCILRGWKGISDFLQAAKLLKDTSNLKWLIVGSGVSESYFRQEWKALGLQRQVLFTGYLSPPYTALAAMDIFTLLSWAHEGVSQASLQAAWLEKPLVTTSVGGLPEICLDQETGFHVPIQDPDAVAEAVSRLSIDPDLRDRFGRKAHELVRERFTIKHTLDQMELIYQKLVGCRPIKDDKSNASSC